MLRDACRKSSLTETPSITNARFQPRALTCFASADVLPSEFVSSKDNQLARFRFGGQCVAQIQACGTSWSGSWPWLNARLDPCKHHHRGRSEQNAHRDVRHRCLFGDRSSWSNSSPRNVFSPCAYRLARRYAASEPHGAGCLRVARGRTMPRPDPTEPALEPSSLITSSFMLHHLPQVLLRELQPLLRSACRFQSRWEKADLQGTAFFFTASLTVTQPPLEPGTAPLIMIKPRATSVLTTSRFCVVTRAAPM